MSILIYAALASSIAAGTDGLPSEICYIPEGENTITPFVNGEPKQITIKVPAARGVTIAAALQSSLDERNKQNVRPWFDFEHKGGASSGLPQSFRYQHGVGIMCALEWTGAGRTAIEGKDFSYFSPTFLMDDDGFPEGLPKRGPLGALVNEPAFREIPRIAASDAEIDPTITHPAMSKLIFAALAISAAHADAESLAVQAIDTMQKDGESKKKRITELECELADLKKTAACSAAEVLQVRKDRAAALVKAAVADGRILPKDEDKQTKFRDKIEAGDTFAEEILSQLPKINPDLSKSLVTAGDKKVESKDGDKNDPYDRVEAAFAAEYEAGK